MKRNGFTLIEILAVIAVIAVLAILIVPNVLEMVDKSKRNLFVAQAKNIYNEAIQEYTLAIEEYVEKNRFYYNGITEENKLNLSGSKELYYDVEIYNDNVTKFIVSDANYSIGIIDSDIKLKEIVLEGLKTKEEIGYINLKSNQKSLLSEILKAHPPVSDAIASTYVISSTGIDFNNISSITNGQGLYINNKSNIENDPTKGAIKYFRGGTFCYLPFTIPYWQYEGYSSLETCIEDYGEEYCTQNIIEPVSNCTNGGGTWTDSHCSLHDSKSACESNGLTYYELKNNVIFGGFAWRIIRINTDGSIRMVYNGTNSTDRGANTQIAGTYYYNSTSAFDTGSGPSNSAENSTALEYATYDNGALETGIHNWYTSNLVSYVNYLSDSEFCSDTAYISSSTTWNFDPYNRLVVNKTPTFNCSQINDKYTVLNGKLGSPIATITADEVAYAGGINGVSNYTYYLRSGASYWTMSPSYWNSSSVGSWYVNDVGTMAYNTVGSTNNGRPVINLKADAVVSQGSGIVSDPWIVLQ